MSVLLNIENPVELISYLKENNHIAKNESPIINVLQGGVSCRTVLVEVSNGMSIVCKQALSKLRVKQDWYSDPKRIHREALGLRWLMEICPSGAVPKFVFEDIEQQVFAMEAVPQPHSNWKELLLDGNVNPQHFQQFGKLLSTIHRDSFLRKQDLSTEFFDKTFFESLRIEPYYQFTSQQVTDAKPFLDELITQSKKRNYTIVHGDYSPKNILIYNEKLVLLDHEVIHVGDPAFDLGFSLAHFISKINHLPAQANSLKEAANIYFDTYISNLGQLPFSSDLEAYAVRHTLGCMLARIDGRSTLEYLTKQQRSRQRRLALDLMHQIPTKVASLIEAINF